MPEPSRVSLRPETPEDAAFLFRVYASTRAEEMAALPWDQAQKHAFLQMQFELQTIHYHGYYSNPSFEIVLCGAEPAGRLYLDRGSEEIRIIDIALLPEYRGVGTGSQLLKEVLREAAEAGKRVSIHVERNNRALRLYERLGFHLVEDKGIYLLLEWRS